MTTKKNTQKKKLFFFGGGGGGGGLELVNFIYKESKYMYKKNK